MMHARPDLELIFVKRYLMDRRKGAMFAAVNAGCCCEIAVARGYSVSLIIRARRKPG